MIGFMTMHGSADHELSVSLVCLVIKRKEADQGHLGSLAFRAGDCRRSSAAGTHINARGSLPGGSGGAGIETDAVGVVVLFLVGHSHCVRG